MNKRLAKFLLAASVTSVLAAPAMAADNHSAGEVLDDTIITTKVKAALVQDPVTKAHQISVDTFKGTVKLSGFVDSVAAEQRAVEVARNIEGTVQVDDALEVRN